jgi:hypothetical protein
VPDVSSVSRRHGRDARLRRGADGATDRVLSRHGHPDVASDVRSPRRALQVRHRAREHRVRRVQEPRVGHVRRARTSGRVPRRDHHHVLQRRTHLGRRRQRGGPQRPGAAAAAAEPAAAARSGVDVLQRLRHEAHGERVRSTVTACGLPHVRRVDQAGRGRGRPADDRAARHGGLGHHAHVPVRRGRRVLREPRPKRDRVLVRKTAAHAGVPRDALVHARRPSGRVVARRRRRVLLAGEEQRDVLHRRRASGVARQRHARDDQPRPHVRRKRQVDIENQRRASARQKRRPGRSSSARGPISASARARASTTKASSTRCGCIATR